MTNPERFATATAGISGGAGEVAEWVEGAQENLACPAWWRDDAGVEVARRLRDIDAEWERSGLTGDRWVAAPARLLAAAAVMLEVYSSVRALDREGERLLCGWYNERGAEINRLCRMLGNRRRRYVTMHHALKRFRDAQITTVLTEAGVRELIEEMDAPPADTPERRATFARAKEIGERYRRAGHPTHMDTGIYGNEPARTAPEKRKANGPDHRNQP